MKLKLLFFALLATGLSASAQSEKKTSLTDSTQVVYATSDGKVKDGVYYIKNTENNNVIVQGNYKNNERIGSWYFFSAQNKLMMRYNYTQKKLAYLDTAMFKGVTVELPGSSDEVAKSASVAVPLCPVDFYTAFLTSRVYNFNRTGALNLAFTAEVNVDGTATYTVAYMVNNKKTSEKELTIKGDKFAIDWIPAMYNNKPVYSEFTVYATIPEAQSTARRTRWND